MGDIKNLESETQNLDNREKDDKLESTGPALNITVGTIYELIGQIKLVARQRLNLTIPIPDLPLNELSDVGEVKMVRADGIRCDYRIWNDTPNRKRHVIMTHADLLSFTNIDEYIAASISDAKNEMKLAQTYLMEPPRVDIANQLCYSPESLGLPYAEMCRYGILDDRMRSTIRNLCQSVHVNGDQPSNVVINSFEYRPRSSVRSNLMNYSRTVMPLYHQTVQEMLDTSNSIKYRITAKLSPITQWDFLYPVCPYNAIPSPLDGFSVSYNMRHEIISELTGFNIQLDSKSGSSFTKLANQSVNRPSYFTDLLGLSYSDSMAEEISAYMMSFLTPGEVLLSVDFSDVGASDFELSGLLALLARIMLMVDAHSTFNNTSLQSIREIDAIIVRWAFYHQVIEKIPGANDDYVLNNYRITGQPNSTILNLLQFRRGHCGVNPPTIVRKNDQMKRYYPGIGERINYAIDVDDYTQFLHNGADPFEWYLYNAVRGFLRLFRGTGTAYLSFFEIAITGMIRFFVRLNDYLRVNWYTNFRNSAQEQNKRNLANTMESAVTYRIRSKTLGYLFKSFSDQDLIPRFSLLDRLKIESGFNYNLIELAIAYRIATKAVNDFDADVDYPNSKILRLLKEANPASNYLLSFLIASNERGKLSLAKLSGYLSNNFGGIFNPIYSRSSKELIPKGVLPSVLLKIEVNRLDKAFIQRLITRKTHYVNSRDDDEVEFLNGATIRSLIEHRSLASTLYGAAKKILRIQLPTPYTITHQISESANPLPLESKNKNDANCSLRDQLIIRPFKLEMLSFDTRDYVYEDDYSPKSIQLETMWLPSEYFPDISVPITRFISDLGTYAVQTRFLCEEAYGFRSLYVLV